MRSKNCPATLAKMDLPRFGARSPASRRAPPPLKRPTHALLPKLAAQPPAGSLTALNQILFRTERTSPPVPDFPAAPGIRHRIYAPGKYTGYDAKTLPGVREAVEAGNMREAEEQADQVARALRNLNEQIAQAQKILEGSLMQTPWGDIEVLDAHVHFFSPAFFDALAVQKGAHGVGACTSANFSAGRFRNPANTWPTVGSWS